MVYETPYIRWKQLREGKLKEKPITYLKTNRKAREFSTSPPIIYDRYL